MLSSLRRSPTWTLSLGFVVLLAAAPRAQADGPAPAPAAPPAAPAVAPAPPVVADDVALAAVQKFQEAWKAKGLKGDDKLMERDKALSDLSTVRHPSVVAVLGDVARTGDEDLRPMALAYLGMQKSTPALAGEQVLIAMKRHSKDSVMLLTGLQSLGQLKYLGGDETLKDLLKTEDYAVKKVAIIAVGQTGDMRLIDELLKMLGVDPKGAPPTTGGGDDEKKSGGKEVVSEGYSYEGAEASVDTGTAGDGDQKAAEKKAKEQIAKNKAAATGGGGGGGAAGGPGAAAGGGGGSAGGRGGSARSAEELKPYILKSLKLLTGQTFMSSKELRTWLGGNGDKLEQGKKAAETAEAAQKAALKK